MVNCLEDRPVWVVFVGIHFLAKALLYIWTDETGRVRKFQQILAQLPAGRIFGQVKA
jgi:hypothetical protein